MSSMPRAIPFILKNPQTQVYELTTEAENFLKSINTPVSIVTVAGLYRTGKSYLLNRVILNKSQGFNVGPTINPCTKGLLIWNQVIHTQDNKNVLVIDTQGLGALDEQANHDMKIFSLAVLLSTTFIYNSVGNIDENALQTLSLVLNLVGNIDQQNQSSRPSFIWVVRDFSLQLIDEKGKTISPKQYLQMALNSEGLKQSQKTQIRKNITSAFNDRDCFTLYKPLIDQNRLQKLDSVPLEQLRPEFVSQTMALRKKIFSNLHPIKLSNSDLKGNEYLMMVQRYLHAINEGKVPNIMDTWTFIKDEKARQISEEIIQIYTQKIKAKIMARLPVKFVQLDELLNAIKTQMFEQFKRRTYQDSSYEQLEQFFHRIRHQIKSSNEDQMKTFLKNLLNKQFETFSKKMYSDYYESIEELASDIDKNFKQMLIVNYSEKVQGVNASISSFLQRKYVEAFKYFSAKLKLEIKKVSQNKDEIEQAYKKQVETLKKNSTHYQNDLKEKIAQMDRKLIELSRVNQQKEKLLELQRQSTKGKGVETKHKLQHLQQALMKMQQGYQDLQTQKKKVEKQMFVIKKENDKQIALIKQKNQYITKQHEEQQRRYQELKKLLDEKMSVQQQEKKKYFSSNQEKFKALIHENQVKSEKVFQLEHKLLQMNEQYNEKLYKLQQKQRRILEDKEKMKSNLIQDFSNKKETQAHQINSLRDQCQRYEEQLSMSLIQRNQLQNKARQLSEELNHIKYSSQKQIAIHLQRIQFHQVQIRELKNTNEEIKKNYQAIIENSQSSTKNTEQKYMFRFKETTQQYEIQFKSLQKQFSEKIYEAKKQLSTLKNNKEDLQIQLSLQKKRHESKEKQFKESYAKLQSVYKNLTQKLSNSQKDFHDLNQEKQQYFTMRIKQLQRQCEQVKEKSIRQLDESQRSSEQALAVLKNYTEMERIQWQKRLQDEKQKSNRNLQNLKFELQKKMMQEKQALQEQNSMLQEKIDQMEKYFNETLQNMKYDNEIQTQKLSNHFIQEKVELTKKNALLSQQIQLTKINMQNQIDQQRRNYEQNLSLMRRQLQNEIKQQQIRYREEKQFLQSKCESLKKTNKSVEQQNLILKNELDKQKALWKQKECSHLKNINDLEDRLSHQLFNHTKTIQQITTANNNQRKRLNSQIDSLKSSKSRLQEQKSNLYMEKDAMESKLNSKLTYLENKIKTNKADYDDLMNKFQMTSNFLNKKVQSMQKQKEELHMKVKAQFQQQISFKQDNYKKQNKQYNDRIYRLQTQNKSLRDKIILMEVKLGSETKNNFENMEFEKLEAMKQEYMKREEQYRKLIDKLKKDNKKLKEERQILQLTNNYEKSKNVHTAYKEHSTGYKDTGYKDTGFKDYSERDSIINGLNDYNRQDVSRSRINLDNSKILNTSNLNQSQLKQSNLNQNNLNQNNFNQSRISNALGENKNIVNRKSNVSPMVTNKKYSNNGNVASNPKGMRQEDYQGSRYY